MVLNDEQVNRFFDTMDSLLYYVNERFNVVDGFTLDFEHPLDDVKGSLVAHTLWENVEVIDDFVRDNPHGLSKRCLETAKTWKTALSGYYALVRYQSGRAMLMGDAGVFSVCGVTYELEGEIGPAPAYVEMVLIPFDDVIIYDGFLQAYDVEGSPSELQRIQDEFEDRCAGGIAVSSADFMRLAKTYLEAERNRELDALLADVARESLHDPDAIPEGFHRGALAGLNSIERETALAKWFSGQFPSQFSITAKEYDKRVRKREPVTSLEGCLSLMTKAELEYVAQALGMGGLLRLRKAEMVAELALELPFAIEPLQLRLRDEYEDGYELARSLAKGAVVEFPCEERSQHLNVWPMEPYIFMFRGSQGYSLVVPDELKKTFAAIDFELIDKVRRMRNQALGCVEACTTLCGVVSMEDAFDQYRALCPHALDYDSFVEMLENEVDSGNAAFGIWSYHPNDYVVHPTLTPDYVARDFANRQSDSLSGILLNQETGEVSIAAFEEIAMRLREDLGSELRQLEQYKRGLVESQAAMPMKPLSRSLLENDIMGELLDNPNVVRLRSFIDKHIPDGQNDYLFADRVVEELVMAAVETGNLQAIFAYVIDLGLMDASLEDSRLPNLITNLYNAMPSWENNGWSPQELYEQVTGRKMFYNEDGTLMKIGAGDPCPCGSGKKYRDCCGR